MNTEHEPDDQDLVRLTMKRIVDQGSSVGWDIAPATLRQNARSGWSRALPKTSHIAIAAGVAAVLIAGLLVGHVVTRPHAQPAAHPKSAIPRPPTTPSSPAPTVPTTTPSPTSTVPTTTPGNVPAACTAAHLTVTLGFVQGATQHWAFSVKFTNTGSSPCSLQGYPGVSFINASGIQVGSPAVEVHSSGFATVVTGPVAIGSGKSASAFVLEAIAQDLVSNNQPCSPVTAAALKVYPPNLTTAFIVRATGSPRASSILQVCTVGSAQTQVSQVTP
jgi:hypothetical protein